MRRIVFFMFSFSYSVSWLLFYDDDRSRPFICIENRLDL